MAGPIVTSISQKNTHDNLAWEIFTVVNGAADTTFTITPTAIKAIKNVIVTPTNAAAATGVNAYTSSFVPGAATVDVVGLNSSEYLVKIEGTCA